MNENRCKHLEMIQGVVNRLSTNSFLLKGWTVVLVSALFALAAKDAKIVFAYLAYFPAFAFWLLDGYFLWQERLYRRLYGQVRTTAKERIDFSMDTAGLGAGIPGWLAACFSKTLLGFHGVVVGTIILVMALLPLSP